MGVFCVRYVLNEQGEPVPEENADTWGKFMDDGAKRIIQKTRMQVGRKRIEVSTVFLGIAHPSTNPFEEEDYAHPYLFETMVFGNEKIIKQLAALSESDTRSIMALFVGKIDIQKRYKMRAEAERGHQQMCEFVEACLPRLKQG